MRFAIVHYHELALKGRNRSYFEKQLVRNLRDTLLGLGITQVRALPGRIRVTLGGDTDWTQVKARLSRVFGISHFSLARAVRIDPDIGKTLNTLKTAVAEDIRGLAFSTFRISTKRADKRFPMTSMELDREIGAHAQQVTGKPVSLRHPELTVVIEVLADDAYVSLHKEPGAGGLPVGVSKRVACLLSGGIDSPVAAYRMMKRGCRAVFIHFHGQPYVGRSSEEKVRDLMDVLTPSQLQSRLYLVPFGEIQRQIVLGAPTPMRIVLYRRMMVRIAEELAGREGCWALVTGDSLGQVASQTPENLGVVEEAAHLPILRPLIGMDKIEITDQAQRIGTFEISIEPDQDCCRLFVPPHPTTRANLDQIRKVERGLDLAGMVKQGLAGTEVVDYKFPAGGKRQAEGEK